MKTYEVTWMCSGEYISLLVLIALIVGSQLIFQFISLLAAICTCKVKFDLLNDSRYVKAIVILTFVNLTTTCALHVLLQEYQDLVNTNSIIGIFAAVITFLSLTFIPKVNRKIKASMRCAKVCYGDMFRWAWWDR